MSHHKGPDTPPRPPRDWRMRRKLSWALTVFVIVTSLIAQIRGDPGRFILLSFAALCLIICLSADRLEIRNKS